MDAQLLAGVGRVKITPALPMWLTGYAGRDQPATEVLQDIWAKVLVVESGGAGAADGRGRGNRVVMVTTDLLGISHEISVEVARQVDSLYGIKRDQLILNASHTHSGPMVWPCVDVIYDFTLEEQRIVSLYGQQLTGNIVKAIGIAMENRAPAKLYNGRGVADFAINRRNVIHANGPIDHDVPVLKVTGMDGKSRCILFGYACHNTTLVETNFKINGDYAGFAQAALEEANPGVQAMFLMGCGGDQNPAPRGTEELAKAHGKELAESVEKVLGGEMAVVRGPVRTAYTTVELPFRRFDPAVYRREIVSDNKYLQRRAKIMLEAYNRGWTPEHLVYPVQVVRFGHDWTILALGGEVVVDYSLRVKNEFAGENLYVAGYSGEVMCYIPSQRVLQEGGYEPDESMIYYGFPGPFADGGEERIFTAIRQVMKKVGVSPKGGSGGEVKQ